MKYSLAIAVLLLGAMAAPAADKADLAKIHTVYLLPMGNGFDQFLANQLSAQGVFRVTTDPARADAFFTDKIGTDFEERLGELLPEPPKAEAAGAKEAPAADKTAPGSDPQNMVAAMADSTVVGAAPAHSLSRARGNFYLVARESRLVIWSAFGLPKDRRPKHLDALAERLAARIKREMTESPKP